MQTKLVRFCTKTRFETETHGDSEMADPSDAAIHWPACCIVSFARVVINHTQCIISQIIISSNLWKSLSALDAQLQQILKLK